MINFNGCLADPSMVGKGSVRRNTTGIPMVDSTKVLRPLFDEIDILLWSDSPIIFASLDRM